MILGSDGLYDYYVMITANNSVIGPYTFKSACQKFEMLNYANVQSKVLAVVINEFGKQVKLKEITNEQKEN